MTLETERLTLSPVTGSDTDAVFEYCCDEELQDYVPVPVPYTRESATLYTMGYASRAQFLWAIRALSHRGIRLDGWFASVLRTEGREPQGDWPA